MGEVHKPLHLFGLSATSGLKLNGDYLLNGTSVDNRTKALESKKGFLRCLRISFILVHKRL